MQFFDITNRPYTRLLVQLPQKAKRNINSGVKKEYRKTFFEQFSELEKPDFIVHHAVERQVFKNYPNLFTESELHSLQNLRGIPKSINSDIHLSKIRIELDKFYFDNPRATKQQILNKVKEIDDMFGCQFYPPIR